MKKFGLAAALCLAFVAGFVIPHHGATVAGAATPAPAAATAATGPTQGWTLHVDAQKHFGDANPTGIAHHWCKPVAGGMIECQIYDSDAPDARLVEVETIVTPAVYKSFNAQEQALWHYHKTEIPKVNATLPGMPEDQAKKVVASMLDTYGKVWMLYDPAATNNMPTGMPTVIVLK